MEEGQWLKTAPMAVPNLPDRFAVFTEGLRRVRGTHPLYLEFGVYRGRTLRWWSEHLTLPSARFVGLDSFQGLPEDWRVDAPKGWFTPDGLPRFEDPRVSLVAGWFSETLAGWEPPEHDQLIVNIDCDLYSSADRVLRWLEPYCGPGTLVYFDDLLDPEDELQALHEWLDRYGSAIVPVAMARWGQHLLFECRGECRGRQNLPAPRVERERHASIRLLAPSWLAEGTQVGGQVASPDDDRPSGASLTRQMLTPR